MTPLSRRGSLEDSDTERRISDLGTLPCDAVIESWLGADPDGSRRPLETLAWLYRAGELSREQCRRVKARLNTDPKFRACFEEFDRVAIIACGERDAEARHADAEARRAEARRALTNSVILLQLEWEGIRVPDKSRVHRRGGLPGQSAPLYWQAAPAGANDFVPRLLDELGTQFGMELVDHACRVVTVAGDADDWIRAVGRARDRGGLPSAVANFLIWQFAASAVRGLCDTDPVLSALNAQIEHIERGYDRDELEAWCTFAGPPKWEALCEEWDAAYHAHLIHILERHEEYEVLREVLRGEEPYVEGWMQICRF